MSTAPFPPTPTSQVRAMLQAMQSVLDLAADAETVTLPTTYVRTWQAQLQGVLDQLETAAPLAEDMDWGWSRLLLLVAILAAMLLGLFLLRL
jgi:hypothetical protein